MSEVWLVRHGPTEWSENGRHTGITDLPLLPEGERRATELCDRLDGESFDLVLTSPLQRAHQTAVLAGFPDADIDPDLVEWRYGDYEGVTTPEIRQQVPGWTVWTHPTPGGESADEVAERIDRAVAKIRGTDGRTLVFGHGHALRALASRWLGLEVEHGRLLRLDTATVSVLGYERESPVILRWNC